MNEFDKLMQLTSSPEVTDGIDLPRVQMHKWLCLGQTEYVCDNGTLSDGHEKITDAQKYAQAIKEQYYLSLNIRTQRVAAKRAMADLIDANKALSKASSETETMRLEADKEEAETKLMSALVGVEDQMRMVKFYDRKRKELAPRVEAQYPHGIEQAELDNWLAVAEYRKVVGHTPGLAQQPMSNVPLPPDVKAQLGVSWNRPDMFAPLLITDKENIKALTDGDIGKYVEHTKETN